MVKNYLWLKVLSLIFNILILASCAYNKKKQTDKEIYFDISKFINSQINFLNKNNYSLIKKLTFNKNYSVDTLKVNWKKEFALILETNINKPALKGEYKSDTIFKNKQKIISYYSHKYPVKKLTVYYNENNEVNKIKILYEKNNFLYKENYKILFVKDSFYKIYGNTSFLFFLNNRFLIKAYFYLKEV